MAISILRKIVALSPTISPSESPTLISVKGKNFIDEKNVTQIAANVTVDGAETSPGSSFSSIENTRRPLMDVTNNLSDDEININNEIINSMFLNILERLDNSEILLDSLRNKRDAANQEIDFLKENGNSTSSTINFLYGLSDYPNGTIFMQGINTDIRNS